MLISDDGKLLKYLNAVQQIISEAPVSLLRQTLPATRDLFNDFNLHFMSGSNSRACFIQNGPLSKATFSLLRNRDCGAIPPLCPGHCSPPEAPLTSYVFSVLAAGSPLERRLRLRPLTKQDQIDQ